MTLLAPVPSYNSRETLSKLLVTLSAAVNIFAVGYGIGIFIRRRSDMYVTPIKSIVYSLSGDKLASMVKTLADGKSCERYKFSNETV